MQLIKKSKWFLIPLFLFINSQSIFAQLNQADIFNRNVPITWLGIDFTQARFFVPASSHKRSSEVTNSSFVDRYIPEWNNLFITEPRKYDVAGATQRKSVVNALDVTDKANIAINKNFFFDDTDTVRTLLKEDIANLVKQYDFKGKTGLGMMFFVEEMNKAHRMAGVWVTFVDMDAKKVIFTIYRTGTTGGFGFRNYWASAFHDVLQNMEQTDFSKWQESL